MLLKLDYEEFNTYNGIVKQKMNLQEDKNENRN